jgi:hypothetical protein
MMTRKKWPRLMTEQVWNAECEGGRSEQKNGETEGFVYDLSPCNTSLGNQTDPECVTHLLSHLTNQIRVLEVIVVRLPVQKGTERTRQGL